MSPRLSLLLPTGEIDPSRPTRFFLPSPQAVLNDFSPEGSEIVQPFRPWFEHWAQNGFSTVVRPSDEPVAQSVVFLQRSKAQSRNLIWKAVQTTYGRVVIDGAKTDGVDGVLKELKRIGPVTPAIAKADGKLFSIDATDFKGALDAWAPSAETVVDGYHTVPGVFSAEHVDPASRLLSSHLPPNLQGSVADLGAGWGYLSAELLKTRPKISSVHLVEATALALDCAKQNVPDDRAVFHWADATTWRPAEAVETVIMNPPFHTGRNAEPDIGRQFIEASAQVLRPNGTLWMVANRHLPYESRLNELFASVQEVGGDNRFKILTARSPRRSKSASVR